MSESMFPAPAGMSPEPRMTLRLHLYVPRTRGDEPDWYQLVSKAEECSPHPRG